MRINEISSTSVNENENGTLASGASQEETIKPEEIIEPVTIDNFNNFSYSKRSHFDIFQRNNYDQLLYGASIGHTGFKLKRYQNLLVYSFITQNIPEGSRILEIGSGDDVIINHFKYRYECWRIEDPMALADERNTILEKNKPLIKDNTGKYHNNIPPEHFDFIFSTSGFDNIPEDKTVFKNILDNIDRMLRRGGSSLHCFRVIRIEDIHIHHNGILNYFNNNVTPLFYKIRRLLKFPVREKVYSDPDLHYNIELYSGAEKFYKDKTYDTFSYNFAWQKNPHELGVRTLIRNEEYLRKSPVYVFHHLMKCGGTSVKLVLQNWFQAEYDYVEDANDVNYYLKYKINTEQLVAESCILSHFQNDGFFLHQRYPEILDSSKNFRIFTFIRDPLKLRASLYYYTNPGADRFSLSDSIMHKPDFIANLFPCDETNYKEVLDRYFFIGILEKMQESFDLFARMINRKKLTLPFVNKSEKDSQLDELPKQTIDKFKDLNKLDYKIYDHCLEKFSKITM